MPERKLEKVKAYRHGVYRSQLMFSDSSSTAEMSHVTSSVVKTTDTVTSSSARASSEGFLTTSATPESPISAQMIQSTIAPFIRMDCLELRFIAFGKCTSRNTCLFLQDKPKKSARSNSRRSFLTEIGPSYYPPPKLWVNGISLTGLSYILQSQSIYGWSFRDLMPYNVWAPHLTTLLDVVTCQRPTDDLSDLLNRTKDPQVYDMSQRLLMSSDKNID